MLTIVCWKQRWSCLSKRASRPPAWSSSLRLRPGVSKATIYKHWPEGKEPLLMELMLLVVGIEGPVDEGSTGDLFKDLARGY